MKKIILILVIGFFTSLTFGQATKVKAVDFITLTTAQRDALPATTDARLIYNISNVQFEYWNGTSWVSVGGGVSLPNPTPTLQEVTDIGATTDKTIRVTAVNGDFTDFRSFGLDIDRSASNKGHSYIDGSTVGFIDGINGYRGFGDRGFEGTINGFSSYLDFANMTKAANIIIPNESGTLALTSDIPANQDLTPFFKHDGTIAMTGNLDFNNNQLLNVNKISFDSGSAIQYGGLGFHFYDPLKIFISTGNKGIGVDETLGTVLLNQTEAIVNASSDAVIYRGYADSKYALITQVNAKQDLLFTTKTGTEIDLSNTAGNLHNNGARSTATAYTIKIGSVEGGNAKAPISTIGLVDFPTITGANPLTGSPFVANAEYDMYVYYDNATDGVQYYFDRTDGIGTTATTQTYIAEHQGRAYCLTTNDWIGLGNYRLTNNNLATSKGTAVAPVYNDADIGLTQLPTGAILDRLEIMLISVSAEITDMDFTMSAIGTDYTVETNGLVETVIVAPTSLNSPTTVGSNGLITTIDLAGYTMTGNKTITYAFKPVGALTATRYMVYRIKLFYTLP